MQVTSSILCNLLAPSYAAVYAPQGDTQTRFVRLQLLEGAAAWEVPAGALVTIRAAKPDGTVCFYDTNEQGESAYTVDGSTVTIELVGQVLAVPGTVLMQVDFYTADGAHLSTFTFRCQVSESAISDEAIVSSDYFSVLTETLTEMQQIAQMVQAAYGAPLVAATAAAMTDHTRVYVYTGSESGYTNGNWYYWDGSAWASGGVYNSSAVNVDSTPAQGSTNPVSSGGTYSAIAAETAARTAADTTLTNELDDVKSALNEIDEWTDAVYVTPGFNPATKQGLHFSEENGALVVYGTPTATRRLCCLNGQDGLKTTSSAFSETLEAGRYLVSMSVSGPGTVVRWDYTYSTFSAANIKKLIALGEAEKIVTFTSPVMIALSFGQVSGENYGTEADPTRITLHIERLTAKDIVAREATGLVSVDTETADETGKTDRKMEILHLLESDGVCRLGPGVFYVSGGIDLPTGASLIGCGDKTVLRLLQSSDATHCIKVQALNTIRDLRISGNFSSISTSAQGARTGVLFAANQDGSDGDAYESQCCMMSNVWIDNFSDSGIKCHNTSKITRNGLYATNVFVRQCWAGINIDYISEFNRFTNINTSLCRFGCINNGGNNVFTACTFTANNTAFYIDGTQPNSAHGTISACSFCHTGSNSGSAIKMENVSNGFIIEGCQIWYNSVDLTGCSGVVFSGCEFGRGTGSGGATINISGGGGIAFVGCMFIKDQTYPPTISISGNDKVRVAACYGSETGAEITV